MCGLRAKAEATASAVLGAELCRGPWGRSAGIDAAVVPTGVVNRMRNMSNQLLLQACSNISQ